MRKFKTIISPPDNLKPIRNKDLFWVEDKKIFLLSSIPDLSCEQVFEIEKEIQFYTELALKNQADYCFDVWLTAEHAKKLKSIWYNVDGSFLKIVNKIQYYEKTSEEKWANLRFSKQYMKFLKWQIETNECLERIFELSGGDEYEKQLKRFCSYFPRPYWPPLDEQNTA
ncbi:MAG: hypothetical protein NDI77_02765 [Geobacteraceae bacterium]|nr:hypothetical protein [Geobacteraceae bacterium]